MGVRNKSSWNSQKCPLFPNENILSIYKQFSLCFHDGYFRSKPLRGEIIKVIKNESGFDFNV